MKFPPFGRYGSQYITGATFGAYGGMLGAGLYNRLKMTPTQRKKPSTIPLKKSKEFGRNILLGFTLGGALGTLGLGRALAMSKFKADYAFREGFEDFFGKGEYNKEYWEDFGRKHRYRNFNDFRQEYGHAKDNYRRAYKEPLYESHTDLAKKMRIDLNGVKTKADLKKRHRASVLKHHPDKGGSVSIMQEINDAWSKIQQTKFFNKLALLRGKYYDQIRNI